MECNPIHAAITRKKVCQCRLGFHLWAYKTAPYKVGNFHHRDFFDFQKLAKYIMNRDENMRRGTP